MSELLLDRAARRRSPATMPGFHAGRPPRHKGGALPGRPAARPVLLNLGEPGGFGITPWVDRVQMIDAKYVGPWELPVLAVTAPTAVLIRPDGYVGWVGDLTHPGLPDALTTWFGPPTAT